MIDRLAGGQAGRFDADQVDQLGCAVPAGFLDHVVAERLAARFR
jgi:hypothetical protein